MIGSTISHYKILEELGRGGMGIVYKAEDTKLDRTVAIKVLPSAALASEEDRARFYREAKATAQLHHPNIAVVHEIDEAVPSDAPHGTEASPFIAMEYIEGETLHDRIQQGPLKLEEAVRIASEIASGLEAAHKKNIVHRDIKSQNVMLTEEGSAKVLDFGLAQTAASTKLTRMGSTLGTVAYMSPEQAQGAAVDNRTDIWSLGVVFYEMIAGRSPFAGEYDKAVIYSILNEDPEPLTALRTGVPMGLEWIVSKCLSKKAEDRYQNAADLLVDLRNVDLSTSGVSRISGAISGTRSSHTPVASTSMTVEPSFALAAKKAWPLISIAFMMALGVGYLVFSNDTIALETSRYSLVLSPDAAIGSKYVSHRIATSPDGRYIAYQSGDFITSRIYIQEWNQRTARPITPETDYAIEPFFSPDGQQLGYFDFNEGDLKRIALPDGSPQKIATIAGTCCTGITWGPNDRIVYSLFNTGLVEQSLDGSQVKRLTELDSLNNERTHRLPQFIVGTNDLLFTIGMTSDQSWDEAHIGLYSSESGNYQIILPGGRDARYVPTGHLVYGENGSLLAARFDIQTGRVENPVRLSERVAMSEIYGIVDYTFDSTGRLVYLEGGGEEEYNRLIWYDRSGRFVGVEDSSAIFRSAKIAPDANQILLWMGGPNGQVWFRDRTTSTREPFTVTGSNVSPTWSPNGDSIAYFSSNEGGGIFIEPADHSARAKKITSSESLQQFLSWSPTGRSIAFDERGEDGFFDVRVLDLDSGAMRTLSEERSNTYGPRISPDGNWIAYVSDEVGQNEVYIKRLSNFSEKQRVSVGGGSYPVWNSNGRELFYLSGNGLNSVVLGLGGANQIVSRVLVDSEKVSGRILNFDYDSQTEEFLIVVGKIIVPIDRIDVVVNWFEELNRLAPRSD